MRKIIIFLCILTYALATKAQNKNSVERNRVSVGGGLTSANIWQIEISYHYMVVPYVGIGSSLGKWKQFAIDGVPIGKGWRIAEEYKELSNIYLHPSLYLASPPTLVKFLMAIFNYF